MAIFGKKTKKEKVLKEKTVKVEDIQEDYELQDTFNTDTLDILVEDGEVENVQD